MPRSLFAEYLLERDGVDIVELPTGFLAYKIQGQKCQFVSLYVTPSERLRGTATELGMAVMQIAAQAGCTKIWFEIDIDTVGASESISAGLNFGFRPIDIQKRNLIFEKEIG